MYRDRVDNPSLRDPRRRPRKRQPRGWMRTALLWRGQSIAALDREHAERARFRVAPKPMRPIPHHGRNGMLGLAAIRTTVMFRSLELPGAGAAARWRKAS